MAPHGGNKALATCSDSLVSPLDDSSRPAPLLEMGGIAASSSYQRRPPLSTPRRRLDMQSLWLLEALSFAAAAALFGVYFYLLLRYDNQLVSTWEEENSSFISRLFRTLPSVVSFITTLMRGAMLLPVASAIGQLKWHHLRCPRRVRAIELMDGASRGYWGAARLLASKDFLSLPSFGAVIILGTIFLGPFLQNTVQQAQVLQEQPLTSADEALLPVSNEIIVGNPADHRPESSAIGSAMLSSVQAGWAASAKSVDIQVSELPFKCSYHYCEWVNFATLGVGSQCRQADVERRRHPTTEVQHAISSQANVSNIFYPEDGNSYQSQSVTRLNLVARPLLPAQSSFSDRSRNLPLIVHLGAVGYYKGTYQAVECVLYWAVFDYESFGLNETGKWRARYTEHNKTDSPVAANTTLPIRLSGVEMCSFNKTTQPCNYTVQPYFHRGAQDLLLPFLNDHSAMYESELPDDPAEAHSIDFSKPKIEMLYKDWIERVDHGEFELDGSLARELGRFAGNLALYMTNNIRSNSHLFNFGAAGSLGPYFAIKKHYAAYPAAFLAASMLFVAAAAWRTRREPIWKNSQLALLYHGFDKSVDPGPDGLRTMVEMERAADGTLVRLSGVDDGCGLKLRREGLAPPGYMPASYRAPRISDDLERRAG